MSSVDVDSRICRCASEVGQAGTGGGQMAIVLELRRPRNAVRPAGGITYGAVTPYRAEGRVAYPDRLVRFIALAPLLASTLIAVVQLSNLAGSPTRILIDVEASSGARAMNRT